jgi:hypothetical protein
LTEANPIKAFYGYDEYIDFLCRKLREHGRYSQGARVKSPDETVKFQDFKWTAMTYHLPASETLQNPDNLGKRLCYHNQLKSKAFNFILQKSDSQLYTCFATHSISSLGAGYNGVDLRYQEY